MLHDPETREVIEVPAPPFADPRHDAVVALDDDNLVIWGGLQRDKSGDVVRHFDDGAVFRIKDRRWDPLSKRPPVQHVEPVANPASWTGSESVEVRALDDDHVIKTMPPHSEALVLDRRTRSWCIATLPAEGVDFADADPAGEANTTAHAGRLYIWRSASAFAIDVPKTCSGSEPRVGCDVVVTDARGLVVTFAWQ
jgi:hypothetical protein